MKTQRLEISLSREVTETIPVRDGQLLDAAYGCANPEAARVAIESCLAEGCVCGSFLDNGNEIAWRIL